MTGGSPPSTAYWHVCLAFDEAAGFDAYAVEFLAAGLSAGERIVLIATGSVDDLAGRLDRLPDLDGALRRDALRLLPIDEIYPPDAVVDPHGQVRAYDVATEEALAAGYTGLRVAADATSLIRTPAQREAFARYEHLIDRYMRRRPMSAVCAYDRRELSDPAIAEVACLHPQTNADVLFRLHAGPGEIAVTLDGELDPSNQRLFADALDRADPRPVDGRLLVDATGLRFVDHRNLLRLRDHARRHGATAVLRASRSAAARLVDLLDLTDLRVEVGR